MLKDLHDQMLAEKPEGAIHDPLTCELCIAEEETPEAIDNGPQGGTVKTYTEEEYNSILAQVANLEAKVNELEDARQESAADARIAEIKVQHADEVAALQTQIDTVVLEAQAAKDEKEAVLSYFNDLATEAARADEIAALRDSRIALVKEHTSFPESRITERADAWAAMDEAAFEAALEDWKTIAPKGEAKGDEIPVSTAMTASRNDNQTDGNALREVMGLRFKGIDPRSI